MNSEIRNNLQLNQWQSTKEVLVWFDRIGNKSRKSFLQLDIVEFYPSITPQLLDKALHFAETTGGVTLTPQQKKIILHSRKSLLFSSDGIGKKVWQKKDSQPQEEDDEVAQNKDHLFDVTMGAPDGAEVCELVGLLLLHEMSQNFPALNFGHYRDDGLASHGRIPSRDLQRILHEVEELFASHGLRITLEHS